jgi:hypothetical protein
MTRAPVPSVRQGYGKVRYFLKIVNLKSPITDHKFRVWASPLYLLFVI